MQMLGWAQRRIDDLEKEIDRFSNARPWTFVRERDDDGVIDALKVKFSSRLSNDIPHIIFDAVNHLRSALDQTAHAIAVRHTGKARPKHAKFPFGQTEQEMVNDANGRCKDLPTEVTSIFRSFKPYKSGNVVLWALNELANTPKHKTIYPVSLSGLSTLIRPNGLKIEMRPNERFELFPPRWDADKYELILGYVPSRISFPEDLEVTFTVALDEVDEVIRGPNPAAVLRRMAEEVKAVLDAAEQTCRCIGLMK